MEERVARAIAYAEKSLEGIVERPEMYGSTSESLQFQAMVHLEYRSVLVGLGEHLVDVVYMRFLNSRKLVSSLHLCTHYKDMPLKEFAKILGEFIAEVKREIAMREGGEIGIRG